MSAFALAKLFDEGVYTALFAGGQEGCVSAGYGSVGGCPAYCIRQDGGVMNSAQVDKMLRVLDLAADTGVPVVTWYDSVGTDLREGMAPLTDAARLCAKTARISGVVPQIAVVGGVCGGHAALAASGADICIAVEGCEMFLTPVFTARAHGDKAASASAAAAAKAGAAHLVAADADAAVELVRRLLAVLPANNLAAAETFAGGTPAAAALPQPCSAAGALAALSDEGSAVELMPAFGTGVTVALATVAGHVCGIVATAGDESTLDADDTAKIARFVRMCDAFSIPLVTVVATAGFIKSSTAQIAGGLRQAARLCATYADATTAKVAVIAGKAVGPAYTALCGADITIVCPQAVVAPIEPAAAASVLYKQQLDAGSDLAADTARLAQEYVGRYGTAQALIDAGLADAAADAATLRAQVAGALDMLASKRAQRLPKKHGNMPL